MVIGQAPLTLPQMLSSMDIALVDEIKVQSKKSGSHVAINGTLIGEQNGQYLYVFSLNEPWEPQDDTPLKVKINGAPDIQGVIVTSTGTKITIATEEPLSPEAMRQISLVDDPTQLLERLREALKTTNEGPSQLGSKSFGLQQFTRGKRPSPVAFGVKFEPDSSQERAIQSALGSEVTYIVGPPGTGKTSTLAAIAFAHLREGHTVLIAAHTNIAVDNAIMKLVDICKDAAASNELKDGRVIRYGTPQLEHRMKSEYGEVHLPTIVKQRLGDLNQRRDELQSYLDQLSAQISIAEQEKVHRAEQWQTERQRLVLERDAYKSQLSPLQAGEQRRISALNAQLQEISIQLMHAHEQANIIRRRSARLVEEHVQQQTLRSQHVTKATDLTTKLTAAQQMKGVTRFFKRIDPKRLAQQLTDSQQQIWYCDQQLVVLQRQMDDLHRSRAVAEKHIERLTMTHNKTMAQRDTSSDEGQMIQHLLSTIAKYDRDIARGDSIVGQAGDGIEQNLRALLSQQENIREQIAAIDRQMVDAEKSIIAEARVVATTLCKTYMNANVRERRFDVVIVDEVSMAPLPAVYVVASHADSSVVAIGDPRQLPPIFMAEASTAAQDWLGKDLFDLRNIKLEDAVRENSAGILLEQQARMPPSISNIARKHVYKGLIKDREIHFQGNYSAVQPLPGKPLLLCDTGDASPVSMKPEGGSRINIYHALCTMEIARRVLASLPPPKRKLQVGEFRVGLVTPYRKQAELLQHLVLDAGLQDQIRAGTVHRFQGLEAEVIIFDTVDSPPLSPPEFTSGQWGTKAMRLVNVAVTRAQYKLIIVANSQYVKAKFHEQDILRLAVNEAQMAGIIKSRDVLGIALPPHDDLSSSALQYVTKQSSNGRGSSQYDSEFLDDRTFYERFVQDVRAAKKQVVIFSPFLSLERTKRLEPILSEKRKEGVRITVIASLSKDKNPTTREEGALLKKAGIELRTSWGMHEKLVFIDEEIVYTGSLNVLSQLGTTEFMERVKSPSFAKKLRYIRGVDTLVDAPTRWGPDITVSFNELAKPNCTNCGKAMSPKDGKYGIFFGCTGYPQCTHTEDIAESHLSNIQCLVSRRCDSCGDQMRVMTNRKDAWLACSAFSPCGYGRRITFNKSS